MFLGCPGESAPGPLTRAGRVLLGGKWTVAYILQLFPRVPPLRAVATAPPSCSCPNPPGVKQAINDTTANVAVVKACHLKRTTPSYAPRWGGSENQLFTPPVESLAPLVVPALPEGGVVIPTPSLVHASVVVCRPRPARRYIRLK